MRIGKTYSPASGLEVTKDTVSSVVDFLSNLPLNTRVILLSPYADFKKLDAHQLLLDLKHIGIARVEIDSKVHKTSEISEEEITTAKEFFVVVDRLVIQTDEDSLSRFADSVQEAFRLGDGNCILQIETQEGYKAHFSPIVSNATELNLKNPLFTCSALTIHLELVHFAKGMEGWLESMKTW